MDADGLLRGKQLSSDFERWDWTLSWADTIASLVSQFIHKPTAVVLNSGLWTPQPGEALLRALDAASTKVSKCSFWKTTTLSKHLFDDDAPGRVLRRRSAAANIDPAARAVFGDRVFDAARVTALAAVGEYWDDHHFTPGVYNALNVALLSHLQKHPDCASVVQPP